MSKNKTKFYAVACGRKPGIYDKWYGEDGAEVQVKGFPNARYQGFSTRREAKAWLREFQLPQSAVQTAELKIKAAEKKVVDKKSKKIKVVIYTDGGCINNPGPGGYGVVLLFGKKRKELSGGYRHTTNNRMELMACIEGLKTLKYTCSVNLYSDSQYVVNGIKKGWAKRWKRKGWMRNQIEPAENADLWAQLLDLCDTYSVAFNWVKGHAGNRENERCDQLAKQAANKKKLLPDIPYETGQTTVSTHRTLF
jgi:ribonuclease HI